MMSDFDDIAKRIYAGLAEAGRRHSQFVDDAVKRLNAVLAAAEPNDAFRMEPAPGSRQQKLNDLADRHADEPTPEREGWMRHEVTCNRDADLHMSSLVHDGCVCGDIPRSDGEADCGILDNECNPCVLPVDHGGPHAWTPAAEPETCPGCGCILTERYQTWGVCADCFNTTDDPEFPRTPAAESQRVKAGETIGYISEGTPLDNNCGGGEALGRRLREAEPAETDAPTGSENEGFDWESYYTAHPQARPVDWKARAEAAEAELERLHSWQGLLELLDEHWPDDIFPTLTDDTERDTGPRLVAALRRADAAERKVARVETELDSWKLLESRFETIRAVDASLRAALNGDDDE